MVVWEIKARRGPTSLVPVNARIVPFPENHVDTGTAHTPESCDNTEIVRIHANMPTVVQIPWRNGNPTMLPWMQ